MSAPRQLVWHPDAPDPLPPNTYTTLAALLDKAPARRRGPHPAQRAAAAQGDGRSCRAGPGLPAEFRVKFKPDKGYTPILPPRAGTSSTRPCSGS